MKRAAANTQGKNTRGKKAPTNTLILKATPNPFSSAPLKLYNGNDGYLYDESDLAWLTSAFGEPKTRETKYGTSFYFPNALSWRNSIRKVRAL